MTFANPAGSAAAAAPTYVRALLDLLGDQRPARDRGRSCCPGSSAAPPGLDDAMLRRPEAPGKWSVIEVIQHLADTEVVLGLAHPA